MVLDHFKPVWCVLNDPVLQLLEYHMDNFKMFKISVSKFGTVTEGVICGLSKVVSLSCFSVTR